MMGRANRNCGIAVQKPETEYGGYLTSLFGTPEPQVAVVWIQSVRAAQEERFSEHRYAWPLAR
jgi:hypothetical protein